MISSSIIRSSRRLASTASAPSRGCASAATVAAMPKSVAHHQVASASVLAPTTNGGGGFGPSAAALACGLSLCTAAVYGANPRNEAECEMMLSPVTEPATGILFPKLCNGMSLAGCGVRYKYGFVKVYAVGSYFDPLAVSAVKTRGVDEIKTALLDPNVPRTIRIVMNRNLSIEKYTTAIVEALEPRMKGEELESLEEFKKLNPKVDLVKGAEMEMTIRGDVLLYKNATGGLGQIKSAAFTRALCATFFDEDAVSPTHVADVLKGIKTL